MVQKYLIIAVVPFFVTVSHAEEYISPNIPKERERLVERALQGGADQRLIAVRECGLGRVSYCYRALIENLDHRVAKVREQSVRGLARLDLERAVPHLYQRLKVEEQEGAKSVGETVPRIRETLIWAIARLGSEEDAQGLEQYLNDQNVDIRRQAASALGELGNKSMATPLQNRLGQEEEPRVKLAILSSLVRLQPEKVEYVDRLIQHLDHEDSWVRYHTAKEIDRLKLRAARKQLQDALRVEDQPRVRKQLYKAYTTAIYTR